MNSILLHRTDGSADDLGVTLPSLPERMSVILASRAALGYVDAEPAPSRPVSDGDCAAVCWAAIGLALAAYRRATKQAPEGPVFRELQRDVVAYGEAVVTDLWDRGFRDHKEIGEAGRKLVDWYSEVTFGESAKVQAEAEGFRMPPADASPAAGR